MLTNELNTKNVQSLVFRGQKRTEKQKYSEKKQKNNFKSRLKY